MSPEQLTICEESRIKSKGTTLTHMSTEPSSLTAKFANFFTSADWQTSHAMPTTLECARFFRDEPPTAVIPSFRFYSSSLTVDSTDSGLLSQDSSVDDKYLEIMVNSHRINSKLCVYKQQIIMVFYTTCEKRQPPDLQKEEILEPVLSLVLLY